MNNNYEYIKVDPKVIAMLGGSDDMSESLAGEFGDDLPTDVVNTYGKNVKTKSMFEGMDTPMVMPGGTTPAPDAVSGLLQQILNELREIKVILAGKE